MRTYLVAALVGILAAVAIACALIVGIAVPLLVAEAVTPAGSDKGLGAAFMVLFEFVIVGGGIAVAVAWLGGRD